MAPLQRQRNKSCIQLRRCAQACNVHKGTIAKRTCLASTCKSFTSNGYAVREKYQKAPLSRAGLAKFAKRKSNAHQQNAVVLGKIKKISPLISVDKNTHQAR